MARKRWLARVLVYLMLEVGALTGVPMRPDEIAEMARLASQPRVVELLRRSEDGSSDPPGDRGTGGSSAPAEA